MYIYPQMNKNKISYSITNARLCKKYMAYLRIAFINDHILGVHDNSYIDPRLTINKDRKQELVLRTHGHLINDMYFRQRIHTKTNLSFIANIRFFYTAGKRPLFFRDCTEYLPLTYTRQYLASPGKFLCNFVNATVYKKNFVIKLGFFGTHLGKFCIDEHIRRVDYLK